MKKYYTVTTLIITVLIIIISIFTYRNYIGPMLQKSKVTEKSIALSSDSILHFNKYDEQGNIHSIEIDITGTSTNNLSIDIIEEGRILHNARVKKGIVDFYYMADWYSDSMTLQIHKDRGTVGQISVSTRFVSLD